MCGLFCHLFFVVLLHVLGEWIAGYLARNGLPFLQQVTIARICPEAQDRRIGSRFLKEIL